MSAVATHIIKRTTPKYAPAALAFVAFTALTLAVFAFVPTGKDWAMFRDATLEMLAGRSPYIHGIFNPPWVFAVLAPLAVLPHKLGSAVLSVLNLAVMGYVIYRVSGKPYALALLATPPMLRQVLDPNLEWMAALSLVLPPQIGLFFALAKPQIGAPLALFWLVEAWRRGGLREVVRVFAPVTVVTLASFVLFGAWPLYSARMAGVYHNNSFWPIGIPFGLALLVYALRERRQETALLSAPFLAPYIGYYSLHVALLGVLRGKWETLAAVVGLWIMFLVPSGLIR